MTIVRVFCRKTSLTPVDPLAFVGDPPLFRPEADEVHVSVTFTWDMAEGRRLGNAWAQYYPTVLLGGPAFGDRPNGFSPGMYVREGVTFTSRGCNNRCPWCLVPGREGKLRLLPIAPGHIVNDNNFLQCPAEHRERVYEMLRQQPKAAIFSGGIDARLVTEQIAEEVKGIRIDSLFLAADTVAAIPVLAKAVKHLPFLGREKLRCYVLIGYGGETVGQAEARLRLLWGVGVLPFAQLYQPVDGYLRYSREWRALARTWSRPAAMRTLMKAQPETAQAGRE